MSKWVTFSKPKINIIWILVWRSRLSNSFKMMQSQQLGPTRKLLQIFLCYLVKLIQNPVAKSNDLLSTYPPHQSSDTQPTASLCPGWVSPEGRSVKLRPAQHTCRRRASLHSRMHPGAPWRGSPGQAVGRGPLPSGPAVGWSPHIAPPAWAPAGSRISSHTGLCLPVSVQKYLEQKEITEKKFIAVFFSNSLQRTRVGMVASIWCFLFPADVPPNSPQKLTQWIPGVSFGYRFLG